MAEPIMLVNVSEEEEARIAILEDGKLQEFYLERASHEQIVGNIYKGTVVNVEPSIEAAFVEFGFERHGFLHASDVKTSVARQSGNPGRRGNGKDIEKMLRRGNEILVQVTKEGIGDKGPALTTYLSLPGRFLVMMPGMSLRGVSRRVTDEAERRRLRQILKELPVPEDCGVIVRTAGVGKDKIEIERDLDYLVRLWKTVSRRAEQSKSPACIYQESDQVIRVIRDVFTEDIRKIIVDNPEVFNRVKEFLREVMPRHVRKVKLYEEAEPLFHRYGVEQALEETHSRRVELKGGGSIVLEQTEALVAIDVNSGQFKSEGDAEETAFRTNMIAAEEIARQIRLRDLGGLVVIDFIDMEDRNHRAQVEEAFEKAMSKDRARYRMLKMSQFCIVEMTRQRRRPSLDQATYIECPTCGGTGRIKSVETLALELIRKLRVGLQRPNVARVEVDSTPDVANYLNNAMRARLKELETKSGKEIRVHANPQRGPGDHEIAFYKQDGNRVNV
jgi:ribonuclease E